MRQGSSDSFERALLTGVTDKCQITQSNSFRKSNRGELLTRTPTILIERAMAICGDERQCRLLLRHTGRYSRVARLTWLPLNVHVKSAWLARLVTVIRKCQTTAPPSSGSSGPKPSGYRPCIQCLPAPRWRAARHWECYHSNKMPSTVECFHVGLAAHGHGTRSFDKYSSDQCLIIHQRSQDRQ